jgi:hypothetical protein
VEDVGVSGYYGESPAYDGATFRVWIKQMGHWVSIIVVQRSLLGLLFLMFSEQLNSLGGSILAPLGGDESKEILFVVVFWPPLTAITGECVNSIPPLIQIADCVVLLSPQSSGYRIIS